MSNKDLKSLNVKFADLVWFFNEGESALGCKSNFSSFLWQIQNGGAVVQEDPELWMDDRKIFATGRYRQIENRLRKLSRRHQRVLEIFFTYRGNWHSQAALVFDEFLGVVLLDHSLKDLLTLIVKENKSKCKALKASAKKEVEECLKAY